jgi:hypothetical protein
MVAKLFYWNKPLTGSAPKLRTDVCRVFVLMGVFIAFLANHDLAGLPMLLYILD